MGLLRIFKYLVLLVLALGLLTLSLANRDTVMLKLFPEDLAAFVGFNQTVELPIFLVILIGVGVGLLIGFIWEWLREYRHRSEAARARAEAKQLKERLQREVKPADSSSQDVLALLEDKGQPAR